MEIARLRQLLLKRIAPSRYEHSLRVAELAVNLAANYGVSENQAYLAGLLHDYGRDLPEENLLYYAGQKGMAVHQVDFLCPVLLHAPVGAYLVKEEIRITDPEILTAIAMHTLGGKNMTKLDKIIYLADAAEPCRHYQGVEEIRLLSLRDLNLAMLVAFKSAIRYVLTKEIYLHPATIDGYNELLSEVGNRPV